MNKTFIGLLIVAAAGAGIFLYLQNKKSSAPAEFNKELLIGKWSIDSLSVAEDAANAMPVALLLAMDSAAKEKVYDFNASGQVFITIPADSLAAKDTSSFAWQPNNKLTWKENPADSVTETLSVLKLDKEQLVIQSADSVTLYFKKAK
jgi:hypothetical protein